MRNVFYIILAIIFIGCSNDPLNSIIPEDNDNYLLKIRIYYTKQETGNQQYVDYGSNIYIYYDIYTMDLANYNYQGEGIFFRDDKIIEPAYSFIYENIDDDKNNYLYRDSLDANKKITILVESDYHKELKIWGSFPPDYGDIDYTITFNPLIK